MKELLLSLKQTFDNTSYKRRHRRERKGIYDRYFCILKTNTVIYSVRNGDDSTLQMVNLRKGFRVENVERNMKIKLEIRCR